MRRMIEVLSTAAAVTAAMFALTQPVNAADGGPTKQQSLMASCNKVAGQKEIKGDERKKFMSSCLKGDVAVGDTAEKRTPQQQKMVTCNKEAGSKELKGEERKKFMSGCLKG